MPPPPGRAAPQPNTSFLTGHTSTAMQVIRHGPENKIKPENLRKGDKHALLPQVSMCHVNRCSRFPYWWCFGHLTRARRDLSQLGGRVRVRLVLGSQSKKEEPRRIASRLVQQPPGLWFLQRRYVRIPYHGLASCDLRPLGLTKWVKMI